MYCSFVILKFIYNKMNFILLQYFTDVPTLRGISARYKKKDT